MNILHISDFHYNGDKRIINKCLPALITTIKSFKEEIDFILFTGDLVDAGNMNNHFEEAKKLLFDPLCTSLSISIENLIFCPGNHDIDYTQIRHVLNFHFKENIKTNEDLNKLYAKNTIDKFVYTDSLLPLNNFKSFLQVVHPNDENNLIKDLYSIHYRQYKKQTIAFICLFSSWLCNLDDSGGKNDYGNLLYPIQIFKEIDKQIPDFVSKKIILSHHPISYMKDFNSYEIENEIYDHFDMLFTGHIHKMSNVVRHNGVNGIYEHSAKATLSNKCVIGCSIIENDDVEENIFHVRELTYIKDSSDYHIGQSFTVTIPIGKQKEELFKLRRKLYEKIPIEKLNANNLLLIKQEDGGQDFLNTYNTPFIQKNNEDSSIQGSSLGLSMTDLYSTNKHLIILGKDKCGKTSLLRRIQLEYLINYLSYNRVPLFLDAKDEEAHISDTYSFDLRLREYLGINKQTTNVIINSSQLVLLIDNFKPNNALSNYLEEFVKEHSKAIVIAVGEDNINTEFQISKLEFETEVYHFKDLRKREIVQYTIKQLANESNKIIIQEKIMKLCKQMELPYNYWTISLFILIHHKASDTYSKNLFSILDVCVDEIFGKKKLLLQNGRVTFEQLKYICAALAAFLFKKHENTTYSAYEYEIINFFNDEFSIQKRVVISPKEALDFLIACGMLKKCINDMYVFRLNGFFEYFLAYQMKIDVKFKDEILNDDTMYLGFRNQLEIYSGFNNSDTEFLKTIYNKTTNKCCHLFGKYGEDKDVELVNKINIPHQLEEKCKEVSIKKSLTSIQKADVEDIHDNSEQITSEVHLMRQYDPRQINIDVVGRYLEILTRVFKNIYFTNNEVIDSSSIFRKIVEYY